MSIQNKIFFGYFLLMAIISCMVAIMSNERRKVYEIESETESIRQVQHIGNMFHRHIARLATYGESVMAWDENDFADYHAYRLYVDSTLQAIHEQHEGFVSGKQTDSLRHLLENKEKHLYHIMQMFREQERQEMLLTHLPAAARPYIVTRKKKGIAGLFGAKEKVEVTPSESVTLNTLNKELQSKQEERQQIIITYTDSLRNYNKKINRQLQGLIRDIDNKVYTELQRREAEIDVMRIKSFRHIGFLIGFLLSLLIVFYIIIHREANRIKWYRRKTEKLIRQQKEFLRQNEALIASRKKAVHTVAHELRTPLNAIMGYTGLIEKEHDPEKTAKYMRNIRQSSDRMRRMLNTLLAFFRLDSGKEQPCLSPCRISILTQTFETEFAPAAMHKGLILKVENRADAFVITDKERILQIGNNLLSNAIKFTENGHVSLTTDFQDGNLVLTVEDTGTGMTAEEQQRVFGAFERLSNAATQDGFGLGLSIVRHIVNMLGGSIRVESEKGEGSRFIAEIPVQIIEETPIPDVKSPARCVPMYRDVIAIDNDEVSLQMMKEMYIHEGVRCDICTNVAELVELVRRKDYSLLLTDLNMAEINGFELLELLRSSNVGNSRTIPVVVTTGSGSCDAEELQAHGFTGSLFKPFSISELMAVTDRCAMKVEQSGRPDFSSLLSYGNEAAMLDKLTTETEKEMQALREAKYRNDLEGLNALTHHLRSSWEILRADQPLKVLYRLLHGEGTQDNEALSHAVDGVLEKGAEIIRLSKEERRKYGQE